MNIHILDSGNAFCLTSSPVENKLAYKLSVGNIDKIATINFDGTGFKEIVSKGSAFPPAWSPDGTQIAFWGQHPLKEEGLCIVSADGSNLHLLSSFKYVTNISWSPDGQYIAFNGENYSSTSELLVIELKSSQIVLRIQEAQLCGWKSNNVVCYRDSLIYTHNILTGKREFLSNSWSATYSKQGDLATGYSEGHIEIVTRNKDKHILKLINWNNLVWSHDGTKLVANGQKRRFIRQKEGLYMFDVEKGKAKLLLPRETSGHAASPSISYDNKMIAFSRYDAGFPQINVIYL